MAEIATWIHTAREAMSIRAHGIARVTPAAIISGAGAALLLSLVAPGVLFSGVLSVDGGSVPEAQIALVTAQYLAALLVTITSGALLTRARILRPRPTLLACAASAPAWALSGLAAASWAVGFGEADAGATRSWFGSAFGIFLVCGWVVGAAALFPVALAILRAVPSRQLRVTVAVVVCVPSALALGIAAAVPPGMVLGATAILIAASFTLRGQPARPALAHRAPRVLALATRRRIGAVTAVTAVLGTGSAVFALTASTWAPAVGDATQAMRTGILAGTLIATITVVATAAAVFPRRGRAVLGPATALVAALLALATSYVIDTDSPIGWPLIIVAAALTGLAGALIFAPLLPGGVWLRTLLTAVISVTLAASFGLMLISMAAFLAPLLAVIATILLLRQPRRPREPQTG